MERSIPHFGAATSSQPGRNDPCPCGSGLKFKKCCSNVARSDPPSTPTSRSRIKGEAGFDTPRQQDAAVHSLSDVVGQLDQLLTSGRDVAGVRLHIDGLKEQIRHVLARFEQAPGPDTQALARGLRLELVMTIRGLSQDALARWWGLCLSEAVAMVRQSGLRSWPRDSREDELFDELARLLDVDAVGPTPIAAMINASLLCQNFELHFVADFDVIPQWYLGDHLACALEMPEVFDRPGDAERYLRHLCDVTGAVHRMVVSAGPLRKGSVAHALGRLFLARANFVQAYFTAGNLRDLYAKRGEIIAATLAADGCHTLYARAPCAIGLGKLRLGVLAQHFGPQTETYFTLSHIEGLDRTRFEIVLYAFTATGHRLEGVCKGLADRFVTLSSDLAEQVRTIRSDRLDVLLLASNLSAVQNGSLLLATHRLAPLQVATVSTPVTTGARHVDVLLSATDNEPAADAQAHYTERLRLMPGSVNYYAYQHDEDQAIISPTRAQLNLAEDQVVFFSGANFFKVLPELSRSWARILAQVPRSALLLMPFNPNWRNRYDRQAFINRLFSQFDEFGVSRDRLRIADPVPTRADVHRILALADVYLDAYPFAGACSMLDPIIVGVPPVVRSAVVGRSSHGASLMRMVGLYDRVCTSEEQYEAQAVSMAMDPAERAAVRDALLALRSTRPPVYFDTAVFSLRVGAALSAMHEGLARSYSRLNAMPHHELVAALQHLANRSVGVNFELNQLTDTGIVSALIEPLFPAANGVPHHVVDVGACYGAMSAPLISNGWTADLFEPDPGACAVLRSQLAAFGAACTIHERAIAVSPSGTVQFHKSSSHGLSGLADSPFGPTESVITVASTTLAEHCRKTELVKIDFLKIDAEGFDFDVLETHDFDSLRPRLIMVEYGTHFPRQGVAMVNEAIARMAQRGYGALVFAYSDDGNFERADWNYRLTAIQVDREIDEVASDADGRPFGNIIFYEYGDREFLLSFYALLETCMPPTQRESCAAMVH